MRKSALRSANIPTSRTYMLVCGDKEIAEGKVAVHVPVKVQDLGTFTIEEFAEILKSQVRQRELKLLGEE